MKLGFKRLGLAGLLIAVIWFWISSPFERRSPYDWTEFDSIEKKIIHNARTENGLYCYGTGAGAPGGVISSWYFAFQSHGIPSVDEAFGLLHSIRLMSENVFSAHPEILPQMKPGYEKSELFDIEIGFLHRDGSAPLIGEVSRIRIDEGTVFLQSGDISHRETIVRESYADFLARFPDTKLTATRDLQTGSQVSATDTTLPYEDVQ